MKTLLLCTSFVFGLFLSGYTNDWQSFTTSNSDLLSNNVNTIVIDNQGTKWFGTDKGLSAYDGNRWVAVTVDTNKQTLADNHINDLAFEITGYGPELWIATQNGVSVISISSLDAVTKATPYRTDNTGLIDNTVTCAAVDTVRHERWFGTPSGVSRFNGSDWRNFDTNSFPSALVWNDVTQIGVDADSGWKYICTKNGEDELNGVSRLRTSLEDVDAITAPSAYNVEWSGVYSKNVLSIFVDEDGSQWYGTDAGFSFHDTTETKAGWDIFTPDEGLIDNRVQAIHKSDDGMAWIGTAEGLDRFEYQLGQWGIETYTFTHFTTTDGLVGNNVKDIAQDLDGSLWIATDQGVSHYSGVTSVEKVETQIVKTHGLYQNYPNPFNPTTTLSYSLKTPSHVELFICNMRGERVYGLVNTFQSAGDHHVSWHGTTRQSTPAPTGVYIAVLQLNNSETTLIDSKKIILVR